MYVSKLSRRSIGRLSLEKAALKAVCACQYYDLRDSLEAVSSLELMHIINHHYDCAMCSQKVGS
jgi:redox-regulated HSP33 family molecular chaperone